MKGRVGGKGIGKREKIERVGDEVCMGVKQKKKAASSYPNCPLPFRLFGGFFASSTCLPQKDTLGYKWRTTHCDAIETRDKQGLQKTKTREHTQSCDEKH